MREGEVIPLIIATACLVGYVVYDGYRIRETYRRTGRYEGATPEATALFFLACAFLLDGLFIYIVGTGFLIWLVRSWMLAKSKESVTSEQPLQ